MTDTITQVGDSTWAEYIAAEAAPAQTQLPDELPGNLNRPQGKQEAREAYRLLRTEREDLIYGMGLGLFLAALIVASCDREHPTNGTQCGEICTVARRMVR